MDRIIERERKFLEKKSILKSLHKLLLDIEEVRRWTKEGYFRNRRRAQMQKDKDI